MVCKGVPSIRNWSGVYNCSLLIFSVRARGTAIVSGPPEHHWLGAPPRSHSALGIVLTFPPLRRPWSDLMITIIWLLINNFLYIIWWFTQKPKPPTVEHWSVLNGPTTDLFCAEEFIRIQPILYFATIQMKKFKTKKKTKKLTVHKKFFY